MREYDYSKMMKALQEYTEEFEMRETIEIANTNIR